MMKPLLQELDSNLKSKDNLINEQNGKMLEMDKIIQSNKAEIDRLEKKNRMHEHKVRKWSWTSPSAALGETLLGFFIVSWCCPRSTSFRKPLRSTRATSAHFSMSWKPEITGCRKS